MYSTSTEEFTIRSNRYKKGKH